MVNIVESDPPVGGVSAASSKLAVTPAGAPLTDMPTGALKPPSDRADISDVEELPMGIVNDDLDEVRVKSTTAIVIERVLLAGPLSPVTVRA
jgi:hypothetical protein